MKSITPRKIVSQSVSVPGSKSISHRLLLGACLAGGRSKITNLLESEDISLTKKALEHFGASFELSESPNQLIVHGFSGNLAPFAFPVYLGNSGTSMRLMAAVAGLGNSTYELTGDARMCARPMKELLSALNQMGIEAVSDSEHGTPPVRITGGNRGGGRVLLDCSRSSQYLSALLFIAPFMEKGLTIELTGKPVSSPYIDLTLEVMGKFQVEAVKKSEILYEVAGGQIYQPGDFEVEPDLSNAGYFWAAGALTGEMIVVRHASTSSLQGDLRQLAILENMGCKVDVSSEGIGVQGGELHGIDADMGDIPDTVPAIALVAAFARGKSRLVNIAHLREKECDRVDAIVSQLGKMGIQAEQGEDWMEITGGNPKGAVIETFNDHRIAMAFSLAGLLVDGMVIENPSCVEKSFPGYWQIFDNLQSI